MAYDSVDKLQNALGEKVFHYTQDKKKAAGRALGTMVEIITYYLLKTWNFNNSISIERRLVEYGNEDISHNVEYSLHPIIKEYEVSVPNDGNSITATKILKVLEEKASTSKFDKKNNNLLDKYNILRNACTIGESKDSFLVTSFKTVGKQVYEILVFEQMQKPYAIFECKRVGIEEGNKKGPQTIEKAKQGAYVARTASSLQKTRTDKGEKYGIIYRSDNKPYIKPYVELMEEIIYSDDTELLKKFILTVGVVSNHGNWFTAENHNKELKVLSQSYDWLIFLTDNGLAQFIDELLLNPIQKYIKVQEAFKSSYAADKKRNVFTKVKMDFDTGAVLLKYFSDKQKEIEGWFNVIAPEGKTITELKVELIELRSKNWKEIL
ncbi:MAG TPA: hypothetical protein DHW42_09425 [Candidatus Marinimicrobia bacterium]|nr:hypothetical protein [Candidatus Neomarinimicrobiota bacterium]